MPRKAPPDIGTCPCPTCNESRPVRKEKTKLLYVWCASCRSKCTAQDYIVSNATLDAKPAMEPATEADEVIEPVAPDPVPEPELEPSTPAPDPAPKPKKKNGFSRLFDVVLDEVRP